MSVEKIIVGRDREDLKSFGLSGTTFIGKHVVGKGDDAHLTNPVLMDVARPHIVLVLGKRGTGKSHTAGTIAEEIARLPKDVKKNLSVLIIDTMGIYWSMKYPNTKDDKLLKQWGLKGEPTDVKLFVPKGYMDAYSNIGVKVDAPLTLPVGELTATDWNLTFGFSPLDQYGIAIEKVIKSVRNKHGEAYDITDIIAMTEQDKRLEPQTKNALINRFLAAQEWGVFEKQGTKIIDMLVPGKVSVIDVSHYLSVSSGWSVKGMLVGLLSRKVFQARLMARKAEEFETMTGSKKQSIPMVWMMIDEAHMFLPNEGETAASGPLHTLIKQGREPGISLLFITQRPNKLHEDALAQADLVISHRLTAQADLQALRGIMQTYMLEDITEYINELPKSKGTAIILDDNSERILTTVLRPRLSWHAGGSPSAIKKKGLFD